jgi:hypothetical protein
VSLLSFVLSIFLSLTSSVTENIERSFLQSDAQLLFSLFSASRPVTISLPEPISFSDQLTSEQAYFFFQKVFRSFTTFAFFPEPGVLRSLENGRFIFQARWSFLNRNRNQYVFLIFFYIRGRPGAPSLRDFWKITEIRAEKL